MIKITSKTLAQHYGVSPESVRYHTRHKGGLKSLEAIIETILFFEKKKTAQKHQ